MKKNDLPTRIMPIKRFFRHPAAIFIYKILGTILCIGLATLLFHQFVNLLTVQYIGLLYLLPVILITLLFGLPSGILAEGLSFLVFDFFFTQPYHSLMVRDPQDLITLTIFLLVAIVISQLLWKAQKNSQKAREREHEAVCIYQLISALMGLTDITDVARVISKRTLDTFGFERVQVTIKSIETNNEISYALPLDSPSLLPPSLKIKLHTGRKNDGELQIWSDRALNQEENRLLQAFCDQAALAIERTHLIESENKTQILEESDKLKTSLLDSVSHELRSPLAVIKASVSSLRIGAVPWNSDARSELLMTIEEETDKLNALVGDLLDMSRIEAGALNPYIKWNSILEIIASVSNKMHEKLLNHPLILQIPENFPLVPTDFFMMEQVFINLFSNCIKYSPSGTEIVISAEEKGDFLLLIVKNQSPNVPEEHLEHIFEKFFRITQAEKVNGTGLGLSICKGIIEAHGGKIWAENLPDGFSFCFTLPRKKNEILPPQPEES